MLAIIRAQLEAADIPYVYFDGSSSASEREKAIREFQTNEDCRVFLISLKAGGVGLNLTAADYVYLVDPWWNPAVEQQAIDRTHRIGQTKAIFAYRLICKDTIEEKMLILQERKRALAADLVADDSAVMKRLTRDDIAFLLS
jgi:non-specific serine/threonine protein kinase